MLAESSDTANSLLMQFASPRAEECVVRLERIPLDFPNADRADWKKVAVPTLVLANRQDPIHPYSYGETLSREIPGAQFVELTPKSISLAQFNAEVRQAIHRFLSHHF